MFIVYRAENSFYSINISPYNFENKSINWQHDNVQMFVTLNSQHYEMINFLEALVAKSLSSNFICSLRYNIIYSFLLSPLPHYLNDVPGITHLFKKLCCYFPLTARRPRGRYIDVRDVQLFLNGSIIQTFRQNLFISRIGIYPIEIGIFIL